MTMHNRDLGRLGEDIASNWLQKRGYRLLERNFRFGKVELDIIAKKDDEIIFIEVKTRMDDDKTVPEKVVGRSKQRNIRLAAEHYMELQELTLPARFDIILVLKGERFEVEHWEDAFYPFDAY